MYRIIGADQREYGPVSRETVLHWINESRANAQSWARVEGAAGWQPLGALAEFAPAFGVSGSAAPPKPPVAAFVPIAPVVAARRTNGMAVASLVMGLLAFTCCCCCHGFPFNVLGIVFAIIALVQIRRAPDVEEGQALAIIGLVLSLLTFVLAAVGLAFGILGSLPDLARSMRHW